MSGRRALLAALSEAYPVIAARLPLAIGISNDLIAAGCDSKLLRRCVYKHVNSIKYQRMLAQGGKRYHLDGTEAQDIDPEHIEFARQAVAEFDRREAERSQREQERKAQAVASGVASPVTLEPVPAPKLAAKTPLAVAVAVIVKKKRVLQVPK